MPVPAHRSARRWWRPLLAAAFVVAGLAGPSLAAAATTTEPAAPATDGGMSTVDAVLLGLIEGITEFLPVSSTGHLTVAQDLLGVGTSSPAEKEAADAYAVVIQAGAILAIAVLYWRRLVSLARGLIGRDEAGRRVLVGTAVAVVPFAVVGLAFESTIKERLFGVGPVIVAWVVGGILLLALSRRGWWAADDAPVPDGVKVGEATPATATAHLADEPHPGRGRRARTGSPLDLITPRQALIIGVVQCLALWPGTSRSLVTIVAALAVGLSLAAAVEFSFLVGLVTLGAATLVDGARHGEVIVETFGLANPVIGFAVAFVSAVIAVRWMVAYLQQHSLAIFGWYRLAVAGVVGILWRLGAV